MACTKKLSIKIRALWDFVPCILVAVDRRFRVAYCLHYQGSGGSIGLENIGQLNETTWRISQTTLNFILPAMSTLNLASLTRSK
jgi:hypothetical protein